MTREALRRKRKLPPIWPLSKCLPKRLPLPCDQQPRHRPAIETHKLDQQFNYH